MKMTPTKQQMKEYKIYLEKESKKFKLTPRDLGNLYDLFYMIDDNTFGTIKLNKMDKWFRKFHERIERIVIPELYKKSKKKK